MSVTKKSSKKITRQFCLGAVMLIAMALTSCSLPQDAKMQEQADQMTPCEKIEGLIKAYNTDFDAIKGPSLSERFLEIWAAKVEAIDSSSCQVWQAGHHTTYMCTRNAPDEAVALDWFASAVKTMAQCLPDWQQQHTAREEDSGKGVVWTKEGNFPTVSAQVVPVRGRQWALYYFVGDRDKWY